MSRKAFKKTLVIVGIIVILFSIAYILIDHAAGVLHDAFREDMQCMAGGLTVIGIAMLLYAKDSRQTKIKRSRKLEVLGWIVIGFSFSGVPVLSFMIMDIVL